MSINTENLQTRFLAVNELNNLVDKHREMRLGQLIYNALYPVLKGEDCFNISDKDFLDALRNFENETFYL